MIDLLTMARKILLLRLSSPILSMRSIIITSAHTTTNTPDTVSTAPAPLVNACVLLRSVLLMPCSLIDGS